MNKPTIIPHIDMFSKFIDQKTFFTYKINFFNDGLFIVINASMKKIKCHYIFIYVFEKLFYGILICSDGIIFCLHDIIICSDGIIFLFYGIIICSDDILICSDGIIFCSDGIIFCLLSLLFLSSGK